jgi:N,N'-diacetylchitobiose transport system permease protein
VTRTGGGRGTRRAGRIALNGAGLLVALFAAFPVYWMIATSLKPSAEIFASTPRPVPAEPTLGTTGRSSPATSSRA